MRIEIYLAILFFLFVLFIYFSFFLSFLFLLSSFPSFLFFFQPLGGGGGDLPIAPPSDSPLDLPRNFILSTYLLLLGRALQKAHNENRDLPRNFILSTCFVYFFFSLFSFSPFLFSLFFIFFVSLWGGGDLPHRPPSDSPLDLPRNFILSTCFVYFFSFFSLSFFSFPLFPLFLFFLSAFGGGAIAPIAPSPQIRHWVRVDRCKPRLYWRQARISRNDRR